MNFKQTSNGQNNTAITFLEDSNKDFLDLKMLDIRRLNNNSEEEVLSIYGFSKFHKKIIFDNRQEALNYTLDFIELKGGKKSK